VLGAIILNGCATGASFGCVIVCLSEGRPDIAVVAGIAFVLAAASGIQLLRRFA
jgi:hypothetical protein